MQIVEALFKDGEGNFDIMIVQRDQDQYVYCDLPSPHSPVITRCQIRIFERVVVEPIQELSAHWLP